MKRIVFILCSLISVWFHAKSQLVYENRVEIPIKDGYTDENVMPMWETGVIIVADKVDYETRTKERRYQLYDTDLNYVKENSVNIPLTLNYRSGGSTEQGIYTLYYNKKGEGLIVGVDGKSLGTHSSQVTLPKKTFPEDHLVFEGHYYGASFKKRVPYLFSIDSQNGSIKTLPVHWQGPKPKSIEILSIEKVPGSNEVFYYLKLGFKKSKTELWIFGADEEGNSTFSLNLSEKVDENLINASASCIGVGEYIITGSYSQRFTSFSEGMFFCHVSQGRPKFMKLYSFTDFEHFLEYLPERRQAKIEKKKAKKEAKGKEFTLNYLLAPHRIFPTGDGYLYFAESFYPTYRTVQNTTTSFVNGRSVQTVTYDKVFDGYQYTHAAMVKFDLNGEKIWDQEFELWPAYKPFYVKRFIHISPENTSTLDMLFTSRGIMHYKSFDYDGNILTDETSDEIDTGMEGDKTRWALSELTWWYGNNFLAYGTQKIKNKELENEDRKRKVFFVNKIRYDIQGK